MGVSVTTDAGLASAARAFAALRAATSPVALVAGGRAVTSLVAGLALGADRVALDARRFADLLESVRAEQDALRGSAGH